MQAWESFFVTVGGAAAVLAGLIFVGISMNLQKMLDRKILSRAAGITLLTLVEVLLVSSFMLVPEQPLSILGVEVVSIGFICWLIITIATITQLAQAKQDHFEEGRTWYGRIGIVFTSQLITLPFVIAGLILLSGNDNGIYWVVPGILSAIPYSLYMGWVLAIEVHR